MNSRIVIGSFDAEKHWKDDGYAVLPQINDNTIIDVINSMDELLIPLCMPHDKLITRFAANPDLVKCLNGAGFHFESKSANMFVRDEEGVSSDKSIFELLASYTGNAINENVGCDPEIDAYAVLPGLDELCGKINARNRFPSIDVVKRVNSKVYSTQMYDRLGLEKYGKIMNSSYDIENSASDYPDRGFVLKDVSGVSGKGNIHINSPAILRRVVRHFRSQEEKGLLTCVVIEPFFEKETDFSCQLKITEKGKCDVVSLQMVFNNGFSYHGSMTASADFISYIGDRGYIDQIGKVAAELYNDGYYGDVCVDSMILTDGEIIPVVEINARKSMGLINYHIDKKLGNYGVKGFLSSTNLGFRGGVRFSDMIEEFDREGILFSSRNIRGILPLSANTVFINRDSDPCYSPDKNYRGRFYYSIISENDDERAIMRKKMNDVLKSLSFSIYN